MVARDVQKHPGWGEETQGGGGCRAQAPTPATVQQTEKWARVMLNATGYLPKRFERKYIISEARAAAIADRIRPHVTPDAFLRPDQPRGYPVYSLYLDSPNLSLYEATAQGKKNRFKLRIRYYDERPDSPIFCEIKRRLDQVVRKQRAGVKRASLSRLLNGAAPRREDLLDRKQNYYAVQEFCRLRQALKAHGTLIVGYRRAAYLDSITGTARLTFDRDLRAKSFDPDQGLTTDLPPVTPGDRGVILEMKYVDRLPQWMQQLIHGFQLERQSVPKYGWSVESIGEPIVISSTARRWLRSAARIGEVRT